MSGRRYSVDAIFRARDRLTAPVKRMQKSIGGFTRATEKNLRAIDRRMTSIVSAAKKLRRTTAAAVAVVGAVGARAVVTGARFEQSIVSAAAKFPGAIRKGSAAFKALEDAARKTGAETEFTASQAAEALNYLAMAGFNVESSIGALPGVVDLATAAGVDLATATDMATDSLGAFNLMSSDAGKLSSNLRRINDVMARTAATANTSINQLFEAFVKGGPVATDAGADIETFSALAGTLANSGIKAEEAGTMLRNMFLNLQAPTGKAAKLVKMLGLRIADESGNMLDAIDIIGQLREKTAAMGSTQRAAIVQTLVGTRAVAGMNILMSAGAESLKGYRDQLRGATGASAEMAATMRDTLLGRFRNVMSAVEGVEISIYKLVEGPLSKAADVTTAWVRANEKLIASKVGEWVAWVVENFQDIVTWAKRIGIAVGVFFGLMAALKAFIAVMTAVNLVMAMNPVGLIVLGVVALIAVITAASLYFGGFLELLKAMGRFVVKYNPFAIMLQALNALIRAVAGFDLMERLRDKMAGSALGSRILSALNIDATNGTGGADVSAITPQVIGPAERAEFVTRNESTAKTEVTIKDQTGRAEYSGPVLPGVNLIKSGAF